MVSVSKCASRSGAGTSDRERAEDVFTFSDMDAALEVNAEFGVHLFDPKRATPGRCAADLRPSDVLS